MAVSALPRSHASAPQTAATLPPAVLLLTLVAPALDLLASVQRSVLLPTAELLAACLAAAALAIAWAHFPRTSWLAAASLAAIASLALRIAGVDAASGLSLLAVLALGVGGAFASSDADCQPWLAELATSRGYAMEPDGFDAHPGSLST